MTTVSYRNLSSEDLVAYLEANEWKLVAENSRWYIFEGYKDINGDSVDVFLPKNTEAPDYEAIVDGIVRTVSGFADKEPETVKAEIIGFDRDIFRARIQDTAAPNSVPIREAVKHVSELRKLFSGAIYLERRVERFIPNMPSSASELDEYYQFGHTFPGSFGYQIESVVAPAVQLHMFDDEEPRPINRLALERIARGFAATQTAASQDSEQPLVDGYVNGFNANMCDAVIAMSNEGRHSIEYSFRWAGRISVASDLQSSHSFTIARRHVAVLQAASKVLREKDPEPLTVHGNIVNLNSPEDPRREHSEKRTILIRWNPGQGRSRTIEVALGKKEYAAAITAHSEHRQISVEGYMERTGQKWQLINPSNFKFHD